MIITKETYRRGLWTQTQDIKGEVWRDVKGFENFYKVSNLGRVKRVECNHNSKNGYCSFLVHLKEKIIIPRVRTSGYLFVTLNANGKQKSYDVHRLVAETFLVPQENSTQVNHKDENVANNTLDNLEWCTAKYNQNYGTILKRKSEKMRNHPSTSKNVSQYAKNGKYIKTYPSINEAARVLNIASSNITQCCQKLKLSAGGFIWRYEKQTDGIMVSNELFKSGCKIIYVKFPNGQTMKFNSLTKAAKYIGCNRGTLKYVADKSRNSRVLSNYEVKYG